MPDRRQEDKRTSTSGTGETLLEVSELTKTFGGLTAVDELEMELSSGELVGLIGPNGAGKTTVFNLLTGVYEPDYGSVRVAGNEIVGKESYEISRLGVGRSFQNLRLFEELSVLDNVKVGLTKEYHYTLPEALFNLGRKRRIEDEVTERAMEVLEYFELTENRDTLAKNLPYGQQKLVELARAWAAEPKVLLLDEPAAGLNDRETEELMELIHGMMEEFELGLLVIEHDMQLVMGICERIVVLDYGEKIAEGPPEEIRNDPKVVSAYLGTEEEQL